MKRFKRIGEPLLPAGFILFTLCVWEIAVRLTHTPAWLLPAPLRIAETMLSQYDAFMRHAGVTVMETLLGFCLAVVIAFFTAVVMEEVKWLRKAVYPVIIASQTIPIITIAPLFLIWFGYGLMPKIAVVVLVCFFPAAISLISGFDAIDPEYLELFRSMNASRKSTLLMLKLPLAMPAFFSGLKISAAYGVMGAVIGEWLGAEAGLGYYMTLSQHSFLTDRVFGAIVLITLLSFMLFGLVSLAEWALTPWRRGDT